MSSGGRRSPRKTFSTRSSASTVGAEHGASRAALLGLPRARAGTQDGGGPGGACQPRVVPVSPPRTRAPAKSGATTRAMTRVREMMRALVIAALLVAAPVEGTDLEDPGRMSPWTGAAT